MKRTRKAISIILSVLMLMQMMTGVVLAENLAPQNLHWATEKDLDWNIDVSNNIVWDLVDGYDLYIVYVYKDNVEIGSILVERDKEYDFGYESILGDMINGGTGSYTVKVATYGGTWEDYDSYVTDENIPVLGTSEMSTPFNYTGEKKEHTNTAGESTQKSEEVIKDDAHKTESYNPTYVSDAEIECPNAVKICYDLGIMPDVYENANKIVSRNDLDRVCTNLFESKFSGGDDTNVSLEQICDKLANSMMPSGASLPTMEVQLRSGVELGLDSYVSYAQLAKIVYNALNSYFRIYSGKFLIDENGQMFREGQDDVEGGLLYVKGYARYKGSVSVSGNEATVSGKLYNQENKSGKSVENVKLSISDKDLKSGDDYLLFVKDDAIISAVSANGAKTETVSKDITPPTVITLTIGDVNATVNGETVTNDVAPMVVNDRTMLPIRFVAEALGAAVDWYEPLQTVTVKSRKTDISIKIGEKYASVTEKIALYNQPIKEVELDSPAFVENDRTYLPLRFVAEKLGADVKWDNATQTITITKK